MSTLTLTDIRQAHQSRDPQFVQLFSTFCTQDDPQPETPIRDGAPTFEGWLTYIRSYEFLRKSKEEQRTARVEKLKAVEDPQAEVPLPDRLKAHEVIDALWRSNHPLDREALLRVIAEVPLVYGPWRALKRIFKEAEAKNDTEVYGALAARFDSCSSDQTKRTVTAATLAYLSRRAWRYLRRVALQLPVTYADAAVDVLIHYRENTNTLPTWVLNHIFFHESNKYGRAGFTFGYNKAPKPSEIKLRAYGELWKRSPRPLFTLLERAQCDAVREFAAAGLKTDFKAVLRDVEAAWVVRLIGVPSIAVHDFVVWILQNVPKFEQGEFRKLGLHEPVLKLLDSASSDAAKYAATYARTHARDLSIDALVKLFANQHDVVRKFARDMLNERDARKDVGLEAWGRLLEMEHGAKYATEVLTQSFGAKELTPSWFADRLVSRSNTAHEFAREHLFKIHDAKTLGASYFVTVIKRTDPETASHRRVAVWCVEEASKLDWSTVPADDLRWATLYPSTVGGLLSLFVKKKIKPQLFGMDFLKMLAYQPDWDSSPWLQSFQAANGEWAKQLTFNEHWSTLVLKQFEDVREYSTADLGLDWLLSLAGHADSRYHTFARERMIRTLAPSDFAPKTTSATTAPTPAAQAAPQTIDLQKKSFLFTGKLKSMQREEAETKVKAANGVAAGSVTKNLHYLVVGDDGSPLYGQGKKGSKQVKAEDLNAAGANIGIISETAFLQMLAGASASSANVDTNATESGCAKLWSLAIAPGANDARLAEFAREYLRLHHVPIAKEENGKAPDPGTEIPESFLAWERFQLLLGETRRPLRDFALEFCEYNFARWNPPVEDLVALSENPFVDVRRFVAKSLLAEPGKDTQRYRLDPAKLKPEAVYQFCESGDEETRGLGMELIRRLPKLQVPEELFRLSESPDRKVRAFVIRALWNVYRDRELTQGWKPPIAAATFGAKAKKAAAKRDAEQGSGVPTIPTQLPAEHPSLAQFLRRILFELPPGPPEKSRMQIDAPADTSHEYDDDLDDDFDDDDEQVATSERQVSLKPIPARRAKIEAIEVMRDLAIEDPAFAAGILPLLDEFQASRGTSERAACLVATTRIRHTHTTKMN